MPVVSENLKSCYFKGKWDFPYTWAMMYFCWTHEDCFDFTHTA